MSTYRTVGGRLGAYIRSNNPSTQQIQSLLGDLLANDELLLPMRDVVARQSFPALRDFAGSGGGAIQRDALLQELARSYLPNIVDAVGQLVNGFLDQPAGETIYAHNSLVSSTETEQVSQYKTQHSISNSQPSQLPQPISPEREWGWQAFANEPLAGPFRSKLPIQRTDVVNRTIPLSAVAEELRIPLGYLLGWCLRKGYPQGISINQQSMLTPKEAFEMAQRYRNPFGILPFIFFLCFALLMAIVVMAAIAT